MINLPEAPKTLLSSPPMQYGKVKWYNHEKGYGFLTRDWDGKEVFVHVSSVEKSGYKTLTDGQNMIFDIQAGRDGREHAVNLMKVGFKDIEKPRSVGSSAYQEAGSSLSRDNYRSQSLRVMTLTLYATVAGVIVTVILGLL